MFHTLTRQVSGNQTATTEYGRLGGIDLLTITSCSLIKVALAARRSAAVEICTYGRT